MALPSTIQVIALTGNGDFDVIQKLEVPFPKPQPDQVLVKVSMLLWCLLHLAS